MTGRPVICLTPVKNEAWILERFLQAASLWADYIIVADQQSSDASREIAASFPKVTLVDNRETTYNEQRRQQLLIDTARSVAPQGLLIALDADEFLTANVFTSVAWQRVKEAPPGTVIEFRWANVRPDLRHYWLSPTIHPWGFVDDGRPHSGREIHSVRVPRPPGAPTITLDDIRVLHYQYANWERMQSKHRWYQCWERVRYPKRRAVDIYRLYHHMDYIPARQLSPIPREWVDGYTAHGIDLSSFAPSALYWWDREVLALFAQYGTRTFRREAVWDFDWTSVARHVYGDDAPAISDPRGLFDRLMHGWLRATQPLARTMPMKAFQKLFVLVGW